ncbi:MAG: gamma-glutamyltransferase [Alphaproteobacteria bacterium]
MLSLSLSRRLLALVAAQAVMLSGCQTIESLGDHTASTLGLADDAPQTYTASEVSQSQRGGVAVADEPLAARTGANVLTAGGSAVDAVATMFFTMSVTYPVAAGLGSGGICLVRDASGQVTEFDFLTKAPRGAGAYALPGAVKGFAEMHRLYGALPWRRLMAPAEAYASTGFPVSQALAVRLAAAQNVIRLDAGLSAEFLNESGAPLPAGSETKNPHLGITIGQIRQNGADGFYKGEVAQKLVAYSTAQGGGISEAEMANTAVLQSAPRQRPLGGMIAYMPGSRTGAGAFSASITDSLSRTRNPQAAASQALAAFGVASLPRDLGSTGFAAVDLNGGAASCAITMNGPFGSARTASGTGVVLALTPSTQAGLASAFLAPVMAVSGGQVAMAGAGAGGPAGTAAAINALMSATGGRTPGRRSDLRGTGSAPYDTVNMISCDENSCVPLADPGAHGAGAAAEVLASDAR